MKRKDNLIFEEAVQGDGDLYIEKEQSMQTGNKKRKLPHVKKTETVHPSLQLFKGLFGDHGFKEEQTGKIALLDSVANRYVSWLNEPVISQYALDEVDNIAKVLRFEATVDKHAPNIIENADCLSYQAPFLRVSATVEIAPILESEEWEVGFIQACSEDKTRHTYGNNGYTKWVFPEKVRRTHNMINDSSGKNFPWYGSDNETVTFNGPCGTSQSATIDMVDAPGCVVDWCCPVDDSSPSLSNLHCDRSFNIWLVALCRKSNKGCILKAVRWNMFINIDVDATKPLGQRSTLVSDPFPDQPTQVIDVPVIRCAMLPPCANDATMCIWKPKHQKSEELIAPKWWTRSRCKRRRVKY